MKNIQWAEIPEFPKYEISTEGDIRRIDRPDKLMKMSTNQFGVLRINLRNEHGYGTRSVGRLVAEVFLGPPKNEQHNVVVHENGNILDCRAANLFWARRWFALAYHEQFKDERWYKLNKEVRHVESGFVFPSAREAAIRYHVLAYDVYRSCRYGEATRMFHHQFSYTV